jgi:hypothetical protein
LNREPTKRRRLPLSMANQPMTCGANHPTGAPVRG